MEEEHRMVSRPTLKWFTVCMFGRRCAHVVVTAKQPLPPNAAVKVRYVCGGCGVSYEGIFK